MVMIQGTHVHRRNAQEKCLGTKRMLSGATQWGEHKRTGHDYVRKDEI